MSSLIDPLIWQALNAYREEAINPDNPFTEDQRTELLKIVDQAEAKSKKVRHLKQYGLLLQNFDNKFEDWGGNMARLSEKIDVIYSEYARIIPGQELINKIEDIGKSHTVKGISSKIRGLRK